MVRVFLDGNELSSLPEGLREFEEEISRDDDLYGFVTKYPLTLTFVGDGYNYLKEKKRNEGFCSRVDFKLIYNPQNNGEFSRTILGYIVISGVTENLTKKTIEAVIEDNNYGSILKQNSKIPFSPFSSFTKNGLPLTPLTPKQISLFTPSTGTYLSNNRSVFDLHDVFSNLILFLSDNKITFQSDFLSNLSDDKRLSITSGNAIRSHTSSPSFLVTLEQLMSFYHKKYNLWFYIEFQGTQPIFRLEQIIYSETDKATDIDFVKDIEESYFQEELWASVEIGGKAIADRDAIWQLPDLEGLAFKEEKYFLKGDCSVDIVKDLVFTDFISDTNIIEKKVTTSTTDHDEDIFVIQYDTSTNKATLGNYLGGTAMGYNEELLNINVINRFCLPNDVALTLGNGVAAENEFEAQLTTDFTLASTISLTIPFDNEIFDTDGNYDDANYIYTAPSTGLYSFGIYLQTLISTSGSYLFTMEDAGLVRLRFRLFDSSSVQKNSFTTQYAFSGQNINNLYIDMSNVKSIYMTAGDYVRAEIDLVFTGATQGNTVSFTIKKESQFKTIYTITQGGVINAGTPNSCKIIQLNFERPISLNQWNNIIQSPIRYIGIDNNGVNNTKTWLMKAKCKLITGEVEWELITDYDNYRL